MKLEYIPKRICVTFGCCIGRLERGLTRQRLVVASFVYNVIYPGAFGSCVVSSAIAHLHISEHVKRWLFRHRERVVDILIAQVHRTIWADDLLR